jgi:excisionase family DNA binding protein
MMLANPITAFHLMPEKQPRQKAGRSQVTRVWWTVEEIRLDMGVSERTVRRWIATGKLTAQRTSATGPFRVHRNAVMAMLGRTQTGPGPEKRPKPRRSRYGSWLGRAA